MEPTQTRLIAGAALLAVLVLGGWRSGGLTDHVEVAVQQILAREVAPEQARKDVLANPPSYTETAVFYRNELEGTLAHLEWTLDVDALLERLRQPNGFYHPITHSAPVVLKSGEVRTEQTLELAAIQEDLRVSRAGLETTGAHTLLRLHNRGEVPLAYHLVARSSEGGDCKMRAITQYDALVLGPDEQARISICSGNRSIEILDLRFMEVSEIGARWIRQVPPRALGLDEIAVRGHKPSKFVPSCTQVHVEETSEALASGKAQWEDAVDFYSRHDCNIYRWSVGYTRIIEPLTELPAKFEGSGAGPDGPLKSVDGSK